MNLIRSFFLPPSALCLCAAFAYGAEPQRDLIQVNGLANGKLWEVKWLIPEAKLKATSEWNSDKEPPISITKAIKAARSHLQSLGRPHTLPVRHISLQAPMQSKPKDRFYFYFISFDDPDRDEPSPEDADVLVLLDGSIVTPVRSTK